MTPEKEHQLGDMLWRTLSSSHELTWPERSHTLGWYHNPMVPWDEHEPPLPDYVEKCRTQDCDDDDEWGGGYAAALCFRGTLFWVVYTSDNTGKDKDEGVYTFFDFPDYLAADLESELLFLLLMR